MVLWPPSPFSSIYIIDENWTIFVTKKDKNSFRLFQPYLMRNFIGGIVSLEEKNLEGNPSTADFRRAAQIFEKRMNFRAASFGRLQKRSAGNAKDKKNKLKRPPCSRHGQFKTVDAIILGKKKRIIQMITDWLINSRL